METGSGHAGGERAGVRGAIDAGRPLACDRSLPGGRVSDSRQKSGRTQEDVLHPGPLLQGRRGRRLGHVRWFRAAPIRRSDSPHVGGYGAWIIFKHALSTICPVPSLNRHRPCRIYIKIRPRRRQNCLNWSIPIPAGSTRRHSCCQMASGNPPGEKVSADTGW